MAGAEQRKARLSKAVLEKGSDRAVAEDERRVRQMSQALMCRLRHDSVEVVQTYLQQHRKDRPWLSS